MLERLGVVLVIGLCGGGVARAPGQIPNHDQARLPSSRPTSPEQALWRQIERLQEELPATQPYSARFAAALQRRRSLLERVQLYLSLYPGGARRDEAIRIELTALFEIGSLSSGSFDAFCARVNEYLRRPPGKTARQEAAYFAILCERLQRAPTATQAASPDEPDEALLRAYRQYVESYPDSRYVPHLTSVLFEQALQRRDLGRMRHLSAKLAESFPEHALSAQLAAQLRREQAVGKPFRLAFQTRDGKNVDTRDAIGSPVLIVVWAGFDPAARRCVQRVEAFRRAHAGVRVFGVSLDPTEQAMRAAGRELEIDWPQLHDGLGWATGFARQWGVRRIPRVFVVDRAGRLLGSDTGEGWRRRAEAALEN